MKKEETVVEVLLRFLKGAGAGAPAPLVSRKGEDGKVVLESYGVPIAELGAGGGELVIRKVGSTEDIPVRKKHRKWLEVIAQEQGIEIRYQ